MTGYGDALSLGPIPGNETCVQVGVDDYRRLARAECQRFINLCRELFGNEPDGARYKIVFENHDYGSYADVEITYCNEIGMFYAYHVERNLPVNWKGNEKYPFDFETAKRIQQEKLLDI